MDGHAIVARLRERWGDRILATHDYRGDHTVVVGRETIVPALSFCRDDAALAFDMLVDLTAVDYSRFPGREDGPRFEVVYHLYSIAHNHRVRLKVPVEQDDAVVPTASGLWPIANWQEREVWDMFGIRFDGHPDLTRILLWEGFNGYPLRKEFPVEGIDTGSAIYPEYYEEGQGPISGTGTGWKPPKPAGAEPAAGEQDGKAEETS